MSYFFDQFRVVSFCQHRFQHFLSNQSRSGPFLQIQAWTYCTLVKLFLWNNTHTTGVYTVISPVAVAICFGLWQPNTSLSLPDLATQDLFQTKICSMFLTKNCILSKYFLLWASIFWNKLSRWGNYIPICVHLWILIFNGTITSTFLCCTAISLHAHIRTHTCTHMYSQLQLIRHHQNSYFVWINWGAKLRVHFNIGSQWSVSEEIVRIKHSA